MAWRVKAIKTFHNSFYTKNRFFIDFDVDDGDNEKSKLYLGETENFVLARGGHKFAGHVNFNGKKFITESKYLWNMGNRQ